MRLLCALLVALPLSQAVAQSTCRPNEDDNEAKLLAFFAAPIAFSPAGNITALNPGQVRLGFELTYIPEPDASISRSQRCFADKTERTHLSPVLPRPRLAIGLPGGWALEATYLPPVTVADATPNMGSVALSRLTNIGTANLLLRVHATMGQVEGAITCPADEVQQSNIAEPCFGPRPSEDTYKPNMFGGEAAVTFVVSPRLTGYAGGGYTSLRPRFQVGFQEGSGFYDNTKIEVDLNRVSLFAGGSWAVAPALNLLAELYSVPEDLTTFRLGASYTWR
jgi:hypothetical protein